MYNSNTLLACNADPESLISEKKRALSVITEMQNCVGMRILRRKALDATIYRWQRMTMA